MKDRGFTLPFSAAITGASAIVGPIFPPSIPLIIYASVTSISALQLLVAGIIPALICVAMLMAATAIIAVKTDLPRAEPKTDAPVEPRDVFVYFITEGKVRAPFGAMALMKRVGK